MSNAKGGAYRAFLIGKTVYCNCDDYRHSQFYRYFADNFDALNLKKLIATGYSLEGGSGVRVVPASIAVILLAMAIFAPTSAPNF